MESVELWQIGLIAFVGAGVGGVSALFGLGGGFLLVPLLNVCLGIPMQYAVGSCACYVLGPATTSLLVRRVDSHAWRLPITLAGGLMVGVVLGASTLHYATRLSEQAGSFPWVDLLVLGVYAVVLSSLGMFSLWETERAAKHRPIPVGWLANWRIPPCVRLQVFNDRPTSITVLAYFGVVVGFLSGLLGISGGLLVLPGLIYLLGLSVQEAVACSMILVWLVSFQSTAAHAFHDNVDLRIVAALLAGGTIGARFGTIWGQRLRSRQLRRSFGVLALASATLVTVRVWILLGSAQGQ